MRWIRRWGLDRATLATVLRLSVASVLTYLLVQVVTPGAADLTGPLTALLVVQANLYATLRSGAFRIIAVLIGVFVAIAVASWVGLTWWSLGVVIGAALLIGYSFRLGDHLLETPISAMLILGVTQHGVAAETRVTYTLLGAVVGIGMSLLFPPSVAPASAEAAVREVADATADMVRRAGEEFVDDLSHVRVSSWLAQATALLPLVGDAEATLRQARQDRRLNPRAIATVDVVPVLSSGLAALDGTILSVRAMLRSLERELPDARALHPSARGGESGASPAGGYDEELRGAFSVVLTDMATTISAFGVLVVAEAEQRHGEAEAALAQTLDTLRETRAILTELAMVDAADDPSTWLLRGSVLSAIEDVLARLDVEARARTRATLRADAARRPGPLAPLTRLQVGRRVVDDRRLWTDEDAPK